MKTILFTFAMLLGLSTAFGHELDVYEQVAVDAASSFLQVGVRHQKAICKLKDITRSDISESVDNGGANNRQEIYLTCQGRKIEVDLLNGTAIKIEVLNPQDF